MEILSLRVKLTIYLLSAAFLLMSGVGPSLAAFGDINETRQIRIGLRIFKAVLAADKDLSRKTNSDGSLDIVLLYSSNTDRAKKFGNELLAMGQGNKKGNIRGKPINLEPFPIEQLNTLTKRPAALVILEKLNSAQLEQAIAFSEFHQRLLYSPFVGDVERGVMAGLAIETRVKPHINRASLEASSVNLKSFFFKVAKIYEP